MADADQSSNDNLESRQEPEEKSPSDGEELLQRVRNLMRRVTAARSSPHPRFLHTLAAIIEEEELRSEKDVGHSTSSTPRPNHVGKLVNLIRDNDDFFELLSSKLLVESRHSVAVKAGAARLLLACLSCGMYPDVFEDAVLSNIKQWVIEDAPKATSDGVLSRKPGESKAKGPVSTDLDMLRTYSLGLLGLALTAGGSIIEEVLATGVAGKLMHYLRIRVLKDTKDWAGSEHKSSGSSALKIRDDIRSRARQPLEATAHIETAPAGNEVTEGGDKLAERETLEKSFSAYDADDDGDGIGHEKCHRRENREQKGRVLDSSFANLMGKDGTVDDAVRGEPSKRKGDARDRGSLKFKGKYKLSDGTNDSERDISTHSGGGRRCGVSYEKIKSFRGNDAEKSATESLLVPFMEGASTCNDVPVTDGDKDAMDQYGSVIVNGVDISIAVKKAGRAAETEARNARASIEAVKAAGEAATDLVKAAALEVRVCFGNVSESKREEKNSKTKKERKRSPSSPSSSPSSSSDEGSGYSSQERQRRGHRRSYAAWKRSSKLKKFKEGGKNISFLTYDGTFGATDKVLAFIQQFDAAFGDEGFTESSKLRHVAMHFQKSARQWWASLRANGEAPKTWKSLRASIMKQFLASDAKDKVLTEWRSLKLSSYESIHKYVDKFWDLHLKATVYKKIDFVCRLPEDMNELNFSSAYHPQTDGQSEIANLTVLDLLKAYVTEVDQRSQWEKYLPLVEYAYNNTVHTSTGKAPFEVIEGRPKSPLLLKVHGKIFAADEYSRDLKESFQKIKENISMAQQKQKAAANKHRRALAFKENDWVLIKFPKARLRHTTGKNPTGHQKYYAKLAKRYYGPFQILKPINEMAYQLKLPKHWLIRNAFHVSLLKPYKGEPPKETIMEDPPKVEGQEEVLQPESVLRHEDKVSRNGKIIRRYLIKFKNYPFEDAKWMQGTQLKDSLHLVNAYNDSLE
ncbi:hypothetical protein L7F22_030020 [Adiantum nelumboides]|nr:hypothetical protein [Adiantum nelumboides]